MARLYIVGGETGDLSELLVTSTGMSIDGTTFNDAGGYGGAYSFKYVDTLANAATVATNLNSTHLFFKFYFSFQTDTTPGSKVYYSVNRLVNVAGTAANYQAFVEQLTDGTYIFEVLSQSGAALGSAAITIAKNTWYRFEIEATTAGTANTGALKVYQDGVKILDFSGADFATGNFNTVTVFASSTGTARVFWLDDYEIDDAALPGAGYVIARSPVAGTPTYNSWAKSTGTDAYAVLNDTPYNATSYVQTWLSSVAQTAAIQSFAVVQSGHGNGNIYLLDTINAMKTAFVAKTAFTTAAGISQIGNILATSSLNGADVTLTFSSAPIAGDVVIIWGGHTATRPTPIGPSTSGYIQMGSTQTQTTNTFGVWYKVMTGTPDTTVVGQGTASSLDSVGYGCIVLRGVDTSNVVDSTIVFANGSSTNPDPGSITPTTTGAAVVICAGTVANDSAWTNPANYSAVVASGSADNNPYSIGGAVRLSGLVAATPENPAAFTSVVTGVWIAATIAIRPSTDAGSAMKSRRRVGGSDTDTSFTLTTSDAYYETLVASAPSRTNLNSMEFGVVHGNNSPLQTVEDEWVMVSYTPAATRVPVTYYYRMTLQGGF